MKHFAEHQFTGVIYDYKNGELSEIALGLFGKRLRVIALHNVSISDRVNPIAPQYINNEVDIENISKTILLNLKGKDEKEDFFFSAGAGLFAAIILKLRTYHPEYCTLPHAVAFFLSLEELINADTPEQIVPILLSTLVLEFIFYFGKDSYKRISIGKWFMRIMVRDEDNTNKVPSFTLPPKS